MEPLFIDQDIEICLSPDFVAGRHLPLIGVGA